MPGRMIIGLSSNTEMILLKVSIPFSKDKIKSFQIWAFNYQTVQISLNFLWFSTVKINTVKQNKGILSHWPVRMKI
jgi:hypothetical protein